ncbi:MAG: hypothetical protein JW874_01395 [Spirochaetales bacterium]|nr:hypothetical protein [Spirochaetales bacterium]
MDVIILASASVLTLALLLFKDRKKVLKGLRMALKRFLGITLILFPLFFLLSLLLFFFPEEAVSSHLSSRNTFIAWICALAAGSVFMLPGFIAFPLGGALAANSVPYFIVSAFTSSLMLVGIITLPVEAAFLGKRLALFRNISAFLIAVAVSLVTGLFFGELS